MTMPDQFSRTLRSNDAVEAIDTSHTVTPAYRIEGKRVERRQGTLDENDQSAHKPPYSQLAAPPDKETWNMVIEAVQRFNDSQDLHHSPFAVRVWAQNTGFRIQVIREKCGTLIKQSQLIPFKAATREDLDQIINSLIGERGVLIDLMR
jgi:hypothetical protein